jgi:hypothetical protein
LNASLVHDASESEVLETQKSHKLTPDVEKVEETQNDQGGWEQLLEILSDQWDRVLYTQETMKCCIVNIDELEEVKTEGRGELGQEIRRVE